MPEELQFIHAHTQIATVEYCMHDSCSWHTNQSILSEEEWLVVFRGRKSNEFEMELLTLDRPVSQVKLDVSACVCVRVATRHSL